jgi:hypothetical protein
MKVQAMQPSSPQEKIDLDQDYLLYFDMSRASIYFQVSRDTIPQRQRSASVPNSRTSGELLGR